MRSYLRAEELHYSNLSIEPDLFDGAQTFRGNQVDLQSRVFGNYQVQVAWRREVA